MLEEANSKNQHVFLWDKTGQVSTYHEGPVIDFTEQMVRVALAQRHDVNGILTESLQLLRTGLAQAMVTGSHLLVNLGMLAPNFGSVYTDKEIFPTEAIFRCSHWRHRRFHTRFL